MGDLGNLLRETREQKGLSLEQAETDTRIRHKFLLALENEDYAALPGPAYVKGFLKTYAAYLGLDPQQVLSLFAVGLGPAESAATAAVPLVDVPMEGARNLWPAIFGLAFVAAVLLLALAFVRLPWRSWLGLQTPTPTPTATATATLTTAPTVTFTPTAEPTFTPTPQPSATTAVVPTITPQPSAEEQVQVQLVVTGRSWVQIVADGEVVYAGLLEDETREWIASESIVARIGNAGAVAATVNGQSLGVLGAEGEVIVQEWKAE